MRIPLSIVATVVLPAAAVVGLGLLLSTSTSAQQGTGVDGIAESVLEQIAAIEAIKDNLTPAQQKIESTLVLATKSANGELMGTSIANVQSVNDTLAGLAGTPVEALASQVVVDIHGDPSASLIDAIGAQGGVVLSQSPEWGITQASLPLAALEVVAESSDVTSIRTAAQFMTSAGSLTSQGYISHTANQPVNSGIRGDGVIVGVLSNSASAARVTSLIASGDLPVDTQVLPGQAGTGNDEGIAMMEIVHDIAPGAALRYATATGSVANFANNILALRAAGAKVIVDDVYYVNEGAFQDGPIARAVTQVVASGALFFSSAGNNGNVTNGTAGTWEGDFLANGAAGPPITTSGTLHNFGTAAVPQNFNRLTAATQIVALKWADPLGASSNDYDLFVLNSTGTTVVAFSANVQSGVQDPFEGVASASLFPANSQIVVVRRSGAARALRLETHGGGRLSIATTGAAFGHNAGVSTVSTAATYWNSARTGTRPFTGAANPNEIFSSDGPRKLFYNPDGSPITPGNLLFATNGGATLQKPDLAAADGVSTRTPGFAPFFGTSAASPHAAGIAALILSARPDYSNGQVLTAMKSTALDSMAPGIDRDSGVGVTVAWAAVQYALTH